MRSGRVPFRQAAPGGLDRIRCFHLRAGKGLMQGRLQGLEEQRMIIDDQETHGLHGTSLHGTSTPHKKPVRGPTDPQLA